MVNIYFLYVEVLLLLVLAVISDNRTYKINNFINYSFILLGISSNIIIYGLRGVNSSLYGILFPLITLMLLHALRMLGAGDIKLFCAIGAIMGTKFILYSMMFSFMSGGLIAIIIMINKKIGLNRLAYFVTYIRSCLMTVTILPYSDFEDKTDGVKMHFSYAIALGTSVLIVIQLISYKFI